MGDRASAQHNSSEKNGVATLKASWHLHAKVFAQIDPSNGFVADDLFRPSCGQNDAFIDDVGVIANTERFAHVMVGHQDAETTLFQKPHDALDLEHGDGIDAGERFVEQDEARSRCECTRNLNAPPLAAG